MNSDIEIIKKAIGKCNCGNNPIVTLREDRPYIGSYFEVICRKCMRRVVATDVKGVIANILHAFGRHGEVKTVLESIE